MICSLQCGMHDMPAEVLFVTNAILQWVQSRDAVVVPCQVVAEHAAVLLALIVAGH